MIKTLLLFLITSISLISQAQNFEGKITYTNSLHSKLPNVTDDQFTYMLGTTQQYYNKGNQYKSVCNGAILQWQLYLPAENRLYNKMSTTDTAFWNDGADNRDSVLSAEVIHNADTVLGYPCDRLILHCLGGAQEYDFNKKVAPIDPSLFIQHKLGNWYYIISRTHALPLKYIMDNPQFTLTSTATSVKPMKLDDAFFDLPNGIKTMKSKE